MSSDDVNLQRASKLDTTPISDGKTLAEARKQLGYHQLQTRRK